MVYIMENETEQLFFRASSVIINVFGEKETLMSICLKSKVSYPMINKLIKLFKDQEIIIKDNRSYSLTLKGKQIQYLVQNIRKEFAKINVKPPQKDGGLQGGRNGRKTR